MSGRVSERLRACMAAGEYYTGLQLAKSIWSRKRTTAFDEAASVVMESALLLAKHEQYAASCEAAGLVVAGWKETGVAAAGAPLAFIQELHDTISPCSEKQKLLVACVQWSRCSEHPNGFAPLRCMAAETAWGAGDFPTANSNFIFAEQPETFANMVFEWSQSGYPSEQDLFFARAVLTLLAQGNLRDANAFRTAFLARLGTSSSLPAQPLFNFVRFLLLTLERDAAPLFKLLARKYKAHLDRDPTLDPYLTEVGRVFYNLQAPKSMMDSMMAMFSGGGMGVSL